MNPTSKCKTKTRIQSVRNQARVRGELFDFKGGGGIL